MSTLGQALSDGDMGDSDLYSKRYKENFSFNYFCNFVCRLALTLTDLDLELFIYFFSEASSVKLMYHVQFQKQIL